jgi:hypothetical protein
VKKPTKNKEQTHPSGQTLTNQLQLDRLCKGFVGSAYYQKAMLQPGYLREEAIRDFLISLDQPFDQALIEMIRQNYYRSF